MKPRPADLRWRYALPSMALAAVLATLVWLWSAKVPGFDAVKDGWVSSQASLLDRHGERLDSIRINFQARRDEWTVLSDISPALVSATVSSEDRRFWRHHGVDWLSVLGAVRDRFVLRRPRGASTISMQLASLLTPSARHARQGRAWLRKLQQVRLALALERSWSKPQILEAYLNLVTFRGELQGIAAASHQLAGKEPSGLNLPEGLVLAALLPSPNAPADRLAGRACTRAAAARLALSCAALRDVSGRMLAESESATQEHLAPQLAHQLLTRAGQRVTTTLDAAVQRAAWNVLRNRLGELADRNVRDGAVLVVDNDSGNVLAYVASGGPASSAANVDGVRARRQAGSTLKPFLYGLALERGYLTAASLLNDSPLVLDTATGVYVPQDYDHDYKGLVSVRTALGNSLNVPAVRTLVLTGVEDFRSRLHELGYAGITESGQFYGYSLALGSAEVNLWEQAQAYRALARGGRWSVLRLLADEATPASKPLLPAAPTFIIASILSDPAARSLTFGFDNYLNTPFWSAVKTGTSKDMRDNWCIGFSRRFTVAVWVGNFEGDSMHEVSGITGAAPIWHDVMLALHRDGAPGALPPPPGVRQELVKFVPAVEPPRHEWLLEPAAPAVVSATAPEGEVAHIESPANGMVIALDPDIPGRNQRVPIVIKGLRPGMRLTLNDAPLGAAVPQLLWSPRAGSYRLALQDRGGHALDQVLFTVR